jgi:Tfp pilus assembly protein PilF
VATGPPSGKVDNNVNKDNLLFLMGGLLVGFVTAYLFFEAMAARQPPRLTPQLRAQIVAGEDGGGGMGADRETPTRTDNTNTAAANGGAQGGGPAMAQIQQLKDYVEKNPNDAGAVLQLANLNLNISNWLRAQQLYNHYLELKPNDPDAMTDLGITYLETQQYDKALDLFRRAKKVAPDHWQSLYNEVVVLMDMKKNDEAGQVLAQLQKMQPGNPDVAKLAEAVARQRNAA